MGGNPPAPARLWVPFQATAYPTPGPKDVVIHEDAKPHSKVL
ncbi:hypothetical protein CHCC14821_4127 [Bacillus paralicheniformis]|nr:hypothetical protein CHCC14821_4127 [Bacillus paralicheniformis]